MDEMKIKEEEEEEIIILLEILMNYTIDKSEFTDVTLTYKMCLEFESLIETCVTYYAYIPL